MVITAVIGKMREWIWKLILWITLYCFNIKKEDIQDLHNLEQGVLIHGTALSNHMQLETEESVKVSKEQENLLDAVKANDVEKVKKVLEANVNNNYGILLQPFVAETPLQLAIQNKNHSMIKLLLETKPEIAKILIQDETPLLYSMHPRFYSSDIFTELSKYSSVNNQVGYGKLTALHMAVRRNNLDALLKLINHPKINLNIQNCDDQTPLHLASFLNRKDFVYALVCSANNEGKKHLNLNLKDRNNYAAYEYENESSRWLRTMKSPENNMEILNQSQDDYENHKAITLKA